MSDLPDGWEWTLLASIAEVQLGRQRSPKNHSGPNMRPYLRAANVTWDGLALEDVKEMNFSPKEVETFRLRHGDILLSEASGSASEVGKPAMWKGEIEECCFQNTLLRVRSSHVDPAYLLWFFKWLALSGKFAQGSRGVGIHHLGARALSGWSIPVAPAEEQKRVVATIEEQFSRLDAATAALQRARRNLKRMRRAVLQTLIQSPSLPTGWQRTTIGAICECLDSRRVPINKEERRQRNGQIPYYGANGQVGWIDDYLFDEPLVLVVEDETFTGREKAFSYKITGKSWVNNHAHVLRPRPEVNVDYLNYALAYYPFTPLTTGTTGRRKLTQRALLAAPIMLPPESEQEAIVVDADLRISVMNHLEAEVDSWLSRASACRQSILNRAFSGKLTSQGVQNERQRNHRSEAVELLQRAAG
jgi:type I restriction enzyme S subunit